MEEPQSFPMGSIYNTVGESSQSRESRPLASVLEIRSRGFQLFDEQPIVHQPQPGEKFPVGDPLVSLVSDTNSRPPTVSRHNTHRNTSQFVPFPGPK